MLHIPSPTGNYSSQSQVCEVVVGWRSQWRRAENLAAGPAGQDPHAFDAGTVAGSLSAARLAGANGRLTKACVSNWRIVLKKSVTVG